MVSPIYRHRGSGDITVREHTAHQVTNVLSTTDVLCWRGFLLNDVLDFSKLEAGKLELEQFDMSLHNLIEETVEIFRTQTEKKGVRLQMVIHPTALDLVVGDPTRVRQVINNLVSNAVKFTNQGSVDIELSLDAKSTTVICISDTGIGMTPEQQTKVFESFTQADISTSRKYGGTGLGLSIVRSLTLQMGGEISVKSELGVGSVFTFAVPFEASTNTNAIAEVEEIQVEIQSLRILIAEDNAVNQMLLSRILSKAGHDIEIVNNGEEAIDRVKLGGLDLVVMDCEMPVVDGYEATRCIRSLPQAESQVPILALTANALRGDREACLAAGMNEYLTKPIRREALFEKMKKILTSNEFPQKNMSNYSVYYLDKEYMYDSVI